MLEAHANVMAVSHSLARLVSLSNSAISSDDDSDSEESYFRDATPSVKAAIKKEEEMNASRPDTRPLKMPN